MTTHRQLVEIEVERRTEVLPTRNTHSIIVTSIVILCLCEVGEAQTSRTRRGTEDASAGMFSRLRSRRSTQDGSVYRSSRAWPGPPVRNTGPIRQAQFQSPAATGTPQQFITGPIISGRQRKRIRDYSWIYIDAPPEPQEIHRHDLVTIIVDEKSEVIMNSKFNRQKNSKLKAELKEFMRIGETGNLATAALNGPTIDAQIQGTLNTTGQLTDQEGIKYRIAATVADVLPNGLLRLEARKVIQTQDDISEYMLTGEVRAADIAADNTASSENIANLRIVKQQKGRIYNSTKRNWGYRLYDMLFPF